MTHEEYEKFFSQIRNEDFETQAETETQREFSARGKSEKEEEYL